VLIHVKNASLLFSYCYTVEEICFLKWCKQMYLLLFVVTPYAKCRLKMLKLERIKDYLLLEEEFIKNQERLKPQEEKQEVDFYFVIEFIPKFT